MLTWEDGYRNGKLDAIIGRTSIISLTWPNEEYVRGYKSGQNYKWYELTHGKNEDE